MTPTQKRLAFPLRAPRYQTLACWPWHVFAAAVEGYHRAFFAMLPSAPQGYFLRGAPQGYFLRGAVNPEKGQK
jgi:hypothetical protein